MAHTEAVAGTDQAGSEHQQYLTFRIGEEMYAIGILAIKEIIEYGQVTEVPGMPPFVRGVINLRGAVVPVLDLRARFGRGTSSITRKSCIVIVEAEVLGERQVIGVMVDSVSEVLDIPDTEIEPAPSFGTRIRVDFIRGMGKVNNKFVIILNTDTVLAAKDWDETAQTALEQVQQVA